MIQSVCPSELFQMIWLLLAILLITRVLFSLGFLIFMFLAFKVLPDINDQSNEHSYRPSRYDAFDIKVQNFLTGISKPFPLKLVY